MKRFFNTRNVLFALVSLILNSGCSDRGKSSAKKVKDTAAISKASTPILYTKADLNKLKWIEGKWKGMDGNNPFYEIYEFINDSTLKITGYEWNGNDSTNSSTDYVRWDDGAYYLGKQKNWKVASIQDTEVKMLPVKASNDVAWRYRDSTGWDAILVSRKGRVEYHMQHFDPFKK